MSGIYTIPLAFTSVSAAVDLLEITGAAAKPFILLEVHLGQTTELGDAAEEQLQLAIKSGQTTSGSGGSAATPGPTDSGGGAAGMTAEAFNTTKASGGTIATHSLHAWNVRGPFDLIFTEQSQLIMAAGRRMTVELVGAPADALTIGGYAVVQEIG